MKEGFYIRYVASRDEWLFYYYYDGELCWIDGDIWLKSTFDKPYKSEGFFKVDL